MGGQRHQLVRGEAAAAGEVLGDGLALDVLHHEERAGAVVADVEHLHDVGVAETGRQSGLLEEPAPEGVVSGEVVGEDLDRHHPAEDGVAGEEYGAHGAVPDTPFDPVPLLAQQVSRHCRSRVHASFLCRARAHRHRAANPGRRWWAARS